MDYDKDKVDDATLALLWLNVSGGRAWKSFDWDTMDRLHEKGYIGNPKSKAKSVEMTDAGLGRAEALFEQFFGVE